MKQKNNITLILIAGGSGSGKTTLVSEINSIVKTRNHTISFLSQDDYYLNQDNLSMKERMKVNYDHPKEIQWDEMYKDIKSLIQGNDIIRPKYIHSEMTHSKTEKRIVKPSDVVVIEGIFALYDKRISDLADIKIFVDTDSDIRLVRRIRRDVLKNNKDIKILLSQWTNDVKPMFEAFISKSKAKADIIVPNTNDQINLVAIDLIRTKIISLTKED